MTSREQKWLAQFICCLNSAGVVDSTAGEVIGLLNDYLFSELPLDIENVHKVATTLCHLKRTLGTACQGLNRLALLLLLLMMNWKWKPGAVCIVQTVIIYCIYFLDDLHFVFNSQKQYWKFYMNWCMVTKEMLCVDLIYSEIDLTLSSLETLAKVFDHPSCSLSHTKAQVRYKLCCFQKQTVEFLKC